MPTDHTSEQWAELLSVLSLDGVARFYAAMEIPAALRENLQVMIRDAILDARRRYELSPEEIPSISQILFERLGRNDGGLFAAWARRAYLGYHADQPEWSAWDVVFSHWAYSRVRDLGWLAKEKRDGLIERYRCGVDTAELKQECLSFLEGPLTDWDLEMFSRRGYTCTWESSPYSTVEAIVRILRLKRFAREVWQNLSERERQAMHSSAQRLIDELGVWMPGPLPSLDDLLQES